MREIEQRSLSLAKWANLIMGFAGIIAAIGSHASALMLDGLFSGVNFLAAVLAAWIFLRVFMPWAAGTAFREPNGLAVLLYGVSLAVAGMFGDLSVSLIKRDVDRKDSSSWLPGLGGLLDVMDSLLWTAPVAYLWWAWA